MIKIATIAVWFPLAAGAVAARVMVRDNARTLQWLRAPELCGAVTARGTALLLRMHGRVVEGARLAGAVERARHLSLR